MSTARTIILTARETGERLDRYVARLTGLSRSQVHNLIEQGHILINGKPSKPSYISSNGDQIVVHVPAVEPSPALIPEAMPLHIVYEDEDLLVVDKPAGIAVYPAPGHPSRTLMNAIMAHYPEITSIEGSVRPGIVHRLDKNTSGLIVVAKNRSAQMELMAQIKQRAVVKKYLVVVRGRPEPDEATIEARIGRHPRDRKRMAVVQNGRESHTDYRVLRPLNGFSLVEATLHTGRTHQIRVHFAHIGHPVAGDAVYGVRLPFLERQFLHAHVLGFRLPRTGQDVQFTSNLPPDLRQALELLAPDSTNPGRAR